MRAKSRAQLAPSKHARTEAIPVYPFYPLYVPIPLPSRPSSRPFPSTHTQAVLDTLAHTRPPGASGRESKSPQFGGGTQIVDLYMYGADFPD